MNVKYRNCQCVKQRNVIVFFFEHKLQTIVIHEYDVQMWRIRSENISREGKGIYVTSSIPRITYPFKQSYIRVQMADDR